MSRILKPISAKRHYPAHVRHVRDPRPPKTEIVGQKAGRAGFFASVMMAGVGVMIGALAAYIGEKGSTSSARYSGFKTLEEASLAIDDRLIERRPSNSNLVVKTPISPPGLREGNPHRDKIRDLIVAEITNSGPDDLRDPDTANLRQTAKSALEASNAKSPTKEPSVTIGSGDGDTRTRATYPPLTTGGVSKIAIVFDDIGLDRRAFAELLALPGPVTFSFLPYAKNPQPLVDQALAEGNGVLLHLPMEPVGNQNPGPHALKATGSIRTFDQDLAWNLSRFSGYTGVNNHMGSKLTTHLPRLSRVLSELANRDLFFLDSVTTSKSVVSQAAHDAGTTALKRDVFLDPEAGVNTVRLQLAQVEQIARQTGYAVAIAHPRKDTITAIGPWLASARLRGFELVTIDMLLNDDTNPDQPDISVPDIQIIDNRPAIAIRG